MAIGRSGYRYCTYDFRYNHCQVHPPQWMIHTSELVVALCLLPACPIIIIIIYKMATTKSLMLNTMR